MAFIGWWLLGRGCVGLAVQHPRCVSAHRCTTHAPCNYSDREIFSTLVITSGAKRRRTITDPSDHFVLFFVLYSRKVCLGFLTLGGRRRDRKYLFNQMPRGNLSAMRGGKTGEIVSQSLSCCLSCTGINSKMATLTFCREEPEAVQRRQKVNRFITLKCSIQTMHTH